MHRYGLVVDGFLGERDLVVKPLDRRLGKVGNISSASVLDNGEPVLIADVDDLVRAMDRLIGKGRLNKVGGTTKARPGKRVLVVDDSLTVREVQRRLLENNGYHVDTAVDGMDGLNALNAGHYDLVVTDVDMPRLSGIGLVERIRADKATANLPVMIVSYKDREEDRLRGLEAGGKLLSHQKQLPRRQSSGSGPRSHRGGLIHAHSHCQRHDAWPLRPCGAWSSPCPATRWPGSP